jgi:hypothetical protein
MLSSATRDEPAKAHAARLRATTRANTLFRESPTREGLFEGPLRGLVEDLRRRPGRKEG